jgi:endonuclease III
VEMVLNKLVPQAEWTRFSHRLILHGRAVCKARKPNCGECVLLPLCPRIGVRGPVQQANTDEEDEARTTRIRNDSV